MSHWDKHAKQWRNIEAPLRPSFSDLQIIQNWLKKQSEPLNVLLLGVTPELASLSWPEGTGLFAVDSNPSMIKTVLLAQQLAINPQVAVGNWLQLPFAESSMHLVLGDGCYSMLPAKHYDFLSQEIVRVLKPEGHFFMRFFIRPELKESIAEIHADYLAKKIANFHILKWRLAMALHGSLEEGVCLQTIWQVWHENFKPAHAAWSKESIDTIEVYKENLACYTFPTLEEIKAKLATQFSTLDLHWPDYSLGERCPTLQLRSRTEGG